MGPGRLRFEQLYDGLGYGEITVDGARDRFELRVAPEENCFKLPFHLLSVKTQVGIEGTRKTVVLDPYASYLLSPSSVGTAVIPASARFHQICLFIPSSRLEAAVEEIGAAPSRSFEKILLDPYSDPYLHKGIVTPAILMAVDQIRSCRLRGSLRRLYVEGKLLEVLALRLEQLRRDPEAPGAEPEARLSGIERDRIHEAMRILETGIYDPPTISLLARRVGLNTTKLKRGFKAELGHTVFGYVRHLRMEQAVSLLRDTDRNVKQVAWEMGYSNPGAFSAAFKREFGFSPARMKK